MFYTSVWDPWLILLQIVTIQCLYYLSLGFCIWIFCSFLGYSPFLALLFSPGMTTLKNVLGRLNILAVVLNGFAGYATNVRLSNFSSAFFLFYVVGRWKKCLDFVATLHIFHFIACIFYSRGFPYQWEWWLFHIIASIIQDILGEYLCAKNESREIRLGGQQIQNV